MTKHRITPAQAKEARRLLRYRIVPGECRTVYYCKQCKRIQTHDFIPFGLGRGAWRNMCHCNAVSSNWIFDHAAKLGERTARHSKRTPAAQHGK